MSAAARVFAIAELHESILHQLPMRDLLLAQRVCSSWKDAITTSTLLLQQLYFTPIVPSSVLSTWKGLLETRQGGWYGSLNKTLDSPELNPVLGLLEDHYHIMFTKESYIGNLMALPTAWRHSQASWRRMLICQPAVVSQIEYVFTCSYRPDVVHSENVQALGSNATLDQIDDRRLVHKRFFPHRVKCFVGIKITITGDDA